jgi:hypothetical protein
MEAALAGGIFGLLQGVLFTAIIPFMGEIKANEQRKAIVLAVVMLVLGALVSAAFSVAIAATQERRRGKLKTDRIMK